MKLKKIVSLAAAALMAVSMLTACGEGADKENSGNTDTEITASSTIATTLRAEMNGNARSKVKAVANSELDAALKKAVDNYCNDHTLELIVGNYYTDGNDIRTWNVGKNVIDTLKAEDSIADDLGDGVTENTTAVEIYAFDASVSDQQVLEWVAGKIDEYVDDYKTTSTDGEYKYAYEISASIVSQTKSFAGDSYGAKFVAFAITQNVTEVV